MRSIMAYLGTVWRGKLSLAKTFWLYGVLGWVVLIGLSSSFLFWAMDGTIPRYPYVALEVITVALHCFVIGAVWRSAGAYQGNPAWKYGARAALFFWAMSIVQNLTWLSFILTVGPA
jgi:hypothetical protein